MHLQVNLVALMLAMTTVVLSNPLAQPSGIHLYTPEGATNSFAKQPRLRHRQISGYPFIARFVEDHRAPRSTATITSRGTPSQKYTKPKSTEAHMANGPLLFPVDRKHPGQDTAGSQPGSQGISSSQPESNPSISSPAESEASKDRIKKLSRLSSPPGTAMSWFHQDTTGGLSGSSGMLSSRQETTTSTPSPAESEAHKDTLKKLKRLRSPPGTAMTWHYWTRRQAPIDVEENEPNAFLAAHPTNTHSGVKDSPSSSQICGAGSVCTSITLAGEGNSIQGLLSQGLRDLPPVATKQESRHPSPVYPSSPEQSSTTSELSRPTASNEALKKHHKWSEMLHFTRRMAPRAFQAEPSQVYSEVNTVPGGPANVVTNSLVCGPSSICKFQCNCERKW